MSYQQRDLSFWQILFWWVMAIVGFVLANIAVIIAITFYVHAVTKVVVWTWQQWP